MSKQILLELELAKVQELMRIRDWLMDNNIIRKSAIPSEGYVAIDCNTGKPFTFQQIGEHHGNN